MAVTMRELLNSPMALELAREVAVAESKKVLKRHRKLDRLFFRNLSQDAAPDHVVEAKEPDAPVILGRMGQ